MTPEKIESSIRERLSSHQSKFNYIASLKFLEESFDEEKENQHERKFEIEKKNSSPIKQIQSSVD